MAHGYTELVGSALPQTPKVYLGAPTQQAAKVDMPANGGHVYKRQLRILFSYHYFKDENIEALLRSAFQGKSVDVFADSGAYSAFTTGATITLTEYADWLAKWGHLFTCAAALDVIGNAAASYQQTGALRKIVDPKLPIIPVYHSRDEADPQYPADGQAIWLRRYIDDGYEYVGLAPGPIRSSKPLLRKWLDDCFALKDAPKYHGFAVTDWKSLCEFPWYSVDSSTWTAGFRYADFWLFDSRVGKLVRFPMRSQLGQLKSAALLAQYGLRPGEIHPDSYDRAKLVAICVEAWQRAEEFLTKRHVRAQRVYLNTIPSKSAPNSPEVIATALNMRTA